jgi:hypothetical protein
LRKLMKPIEPILDARETSVVLPFDRLPTEAVLRRTARQSDENTIQRIWAERMLERLKRKGLARGLETKLLFLRLSRELAILATSHELCNGYVPLFQRQAGDTTLTVLGYTNACRGYIPTRRVRLEGGYEGKTSITGFGLAAPFRPSVEAVLLRATQDFHR